MNPLTHALVGYCIAGWPGAAVACAPDLPMLAADAMQVARGVDIAAARAAGTLPTSRVERALLELHWFVHSLAGAVGVFGGPLGIAFASHVLLDMVSHESTRLAPNTVLFFVPKPNGDTEFFAVLAAAAWLCVRRLH
jgi:hypothetical protein